MADFKLVPGDRFTENELSDRLGVSRTPVRQALFRLQQEGYVDVLFRSGWHVLPFDFEQFEQLYDLRMVLETTAVQRLCSDGTTGGQRHARRAGRHLAGARDRTQRGHGRGLAVRRGLPLRPGRGRRQRRDGPGAQDVTERIRIIRRLDFTKQARIDATYDEHAKILKAIQRKRGDQAAMLLRAHIETSQAEVRKITLHQVHLARQGGGNAAG